MGWRDYLLCFALLVSDSAQGVPVIALLSHRDRNSTGLNRISLTLNRNRRYSRFCAVLVEDTMRRTDKTIFPIQAR